MTSRIAKLPQLTLLFVLLIVAANGFAQDGKVIDVFEDQSTMKSTRIRVESTDGAPLSAVGDADYSGSIDGGFTLKFEKKGSGIFVPAKIEGRSVYFLFDTGATYTSLPASFAKSVGISPRAGYPVIAMQSANGLMHAQLGVMNSLVLGGRLHSGVTFVVCNACPEGTHKGKPVVGLLGMNVIGRYRTTFDHSRGVIEMAPSGVYSDRFRDIQPWLKMEFGRTTLARGGKGWVLHGRVRNLSPRKVKQVTLRHWCEGGTPSESAKTVAAGKSAKFEVLVKDGDCDAGFHGEIANARW